MGKIKRSLALLLTVLTICTSQGLWVMAEDANTQTSDNPVATEEVTQEKDTVPTEGTSAEGIQENVKEVIPENAKDVFEYVYIDEQVVRTPSAQNIVIAFLDTAVKPEQAILNYHSSITGEKLSLEASGFADNTMLFTKTYDQALEDEYQFDNVIYKQSGQEGETTILFSQEENVTGYKVTAEAAVKEPAEESGVGVTAYTIDEAGNAVEQTGDSTENVVAEVLNQADTNQTAMLSNGASRSRARGAESRAGEFIVAICAGHDSTHTGASGHGLREEQLTLKVAQYCKEELEKYSGVRVYMVRDSEACPNPGTTKGSDNEARINKAVAAGARLYVDIHFNAGGGTGAEIWIPNESYRPNLHQEAEQLANKMLAQLTALGLPNRGAKIKNTTLTGKDGEYPDGSVADYYNTSIMCKEAGIPGIIVEHAFLDNANDAAKLQDEAFIKKIGIADATGIAQQYGLTHGSSKPQVSVVNRNEFQGTFRVLVTGVIGASSIQIPTWSAENGQDDDIKWYTAINDGGGTFHVDIKTSDHKNATGLYYAHVYNGPNLLCDTSVTMAKASAIVKTNEIGNNQMQYTTSTQISNSSSELASVTYATWSDKNGQDDVKWSNAVRTGDVWKGTVNISDFKTEGTYQVHAYGKTTEGTEVFLGSSVFKVDAPSVDSLEVQNYNKEKGTFDVVVSGIHSPSGISQIQVPVWCADNQNDIKWYVASRQNDGSYKVSVNVANHKNAVGTYKIHMYATAGNGIAIFKGTEFAVSALTVNVKLSASDSSGNETQYELVAANVGSLGNISNVSFATWSLQGGQDDIVWYPGIQNNQGAWTTAVNISRHKTAGDYVVHAYATMADGTQRFLGTTSFKIKGITAEKLNVVNYDRDKGTFDVIVSGIHAPSGISQIQIPIWCANDQSDLVWHLAIKQRDGNYKVSVNVAQHKYAAGMYKIHMYATSGNGITIFNGMEFPISAVSTDVAISTFDISGNETNFGLSASNVGRLGNIRAVRFATWSLQGGQDDVVWYSGTQSEQGVWNATANISRHKTAGKYAVHAYAILEDGTERFLGTSSFTVKDVIVKKLEVVNYQKNNGTFEVSISGIEATSGIAQVQIPIWCANDQSDIQWYTAQRQADGSYKVNVNIANHKYASGTYKIHTYVTAKNGLVGFKGMETIVDLPNIGISASDISGNETRYALSATNVGRLGSIRAVKFATWSLQGDQDDVVWYSGEQNVQGAWIATAEISRHKTAGAYEAHVYATLSDGTERFLGTTSFRVTPPTAVTNIQNYNNIQGTFDVIIRDIVAPSGVTQVQVPVWCADNQSDIKWYVASRQVDGTYKVTVDAIYHKNHSGLYQVHVYLHNGNGTTAFALAGSQMVNVPELYRVMGATTTSVDQMMRYFNASGVNYPANDLNKGGAGDLKTFCQIFCEEANAEGVRAEVAFTQTMKETGWLRFGGIITIDQFNFCGLGATDVNGQANKASFPDVRTGIRAQIQHLKAYASVEGLKNTCVDPRFHLVKKGCAPYVQWLGQKENPGGYGWATSEKYGYDIVGMINNLKSM